MWTSIWRRSSENGEHGAPDRGQCRLGRPFASARRRLCRQAQAIIANTIFPTCLPTPTSRRSPPRSRRDGSASKPTKQFKEELGLDHFEGRSWHGMHRHALMTPQRIHEKGMQPMPCEEAWLIGERRASGEWTIGDPHAHGGEEGRQRPLVPLRQLTHRHFVVVRTSSAGSEI
jgi:hypothetical protein